MLEPPADHAPTGLLERSVYWLFLVGVPSMLAAEIIVDYQPAKLGALFFVLFWFPMLVVHEAGHGIVAAILGWHVPLIVIGMGRPILVFRLGSTVVEVRVLPLEGFVVPLPKNLRAVRWKSALIYFAGPGAELLVLGFLIWTVGFGELLTRTENVTLIAAQTLAIIILISVFVNLTPHSVGTQNGQVPNDGLGILQSCVRPDDHYADLVEMTRLAQETIEEEPLP